MHFALPLPWWAAFVATVAVALVAWLPYRRVLVPMEPWQRWALTGLRFAALLLVLLFTFRPVALLPPTSARDAVVPILVDTSRSMRIADADGQTRMASAAALVSRDLVPAISRTYRTEILTVGDSLQTGAVERLEATASQTDLSGALRAVRDRYRGRRVAGVVLISDGADTGTGVAGSDGSGPPVFAIGVGSAGALRDREVLAMSAGDARLDQSTVDLRVSAITAGFGRAPFPIRILENGRLVETRRVTAPADGSPIEETFTVTPNQAGPTVYTAEIPAQDGEAVTENNTRSILVNPAGRKRHVLMLEGAPGFEHTFLRRELVRDPSLDVDSVVRKGKNEQGRDTFFVQADAARTPALLNGFPARREDLFAYDALIIANVEGDFFTRAQLGLMADFVSERGGGLLLLGGRSFGQRGLIGTPIEAALPVQLDERSAGVARASLAGATESSGHNRVTLTTDGEEHPIMRVGRTREETRRIWAAMPPLAGGAVLGNPRPGATVLALTQLASGGMFPLVAVQRFGQGRSMVFTGEASWRWKMMMPSTDRTHEYFWRLAVRWLASGAPDQVAVTLPQSPEPRETVTVQVDVRNASFEPVNGATVVATATPPSGRATPVTLRPDGQTPGRYVGTVQPDQSGLFRVRAEVTRGTTSGPSERWMYVGGADREFADPRLNEGFLRRVTRATGGRYVRTQDAARVAAWLNETSVRDAAPERRDLWHGAWPFALVIALLSTEWVLRRRWGLR